MALIIEEFDDAASDTGCLIYWATNRSDVKMACDVPFCAYHNALDGQLERPVVTSFRDGAVLQSSDEMGPMANYAAVARLHRSSFVRRRPA